MNEVWDRAVNRLSYAVKVMENELDVEGIYDNVHHLSKIVATSGLYDDGRPMYGEWDSYRAPTLTPGVWQHPYEFASLMILLRKLGVESVLEVGTFYGFMSVLLSRYLQCDYHAYDHLRYLPEEVEKLPLFNHWVKYHFGAPPTLDFVPDVVILDGDHGYIETLKQYERYSASPIIVFHDINDEACARLEQGGGVPRLWKEVKATRPSVEITRPDGAKWMGFGILL